MDYQQFLLIQAQLLGKSQVSFSSFGSDLSLEKVEKGWKLSSLLHRAEGKLPEAVRDCVSPSGAFQWQKKGAHLSLSEVGDTVYLVHEIEPMKDYLPFKTLVHDFVQVVEEWIDILRNSKK